MGEYGGEDLFIILPSADSVMEGIGILEGVACEFLIKRDSCIQLVCVSCC